MSTYVTPIVIIALAVFAIFRERQQAARQGRPIRTWLAVLIGIGIVLAGASLVLALTP